MYWKAGMYGGLSFALILAVVWVVPKFGPELQIAWWLYVAAGLLLLAAGNLLMRRRN